MQKSKSQSNLSSIEIGEESVSPNMKIKNKYNQMLPESLQLINGPVRVMHVQDNDLKKKGTGTSLTYRSEQ